MSRRRVAALSLLFVLSAAAAALAQQTPAPAAGARAGGSARTRPPLFFKEEWRQNGDESNPIHLWTGMCTSPCGASLRHQTSMVDLTGLARIKWNTKMSGFNQGTFVSNPDLTRVDEVGFIDLMPSSGHGPGGWSDLPQIEVYGRPVPR